MAKKTKKDDYLCLWETEVVTVSSETQCQNGRIKTAFEVKTKTKPHPCIYWNKFYAKPGDKIRMKGFFNKDNLFIVESVFVVPQNFRKSFNDTR